MGERVGALTRSPASTAGALFGMWFLAVPLTVIAAAFLQSWQRVRFTMQCLLVRGACPAVRGASLDRSRRAQLAKTLGTLGLAYLMWPTCVACARAGSPTARRPAHCPLPLLSSRASAYFKVAVNSAYAYESL